MESYKLFQPDLVIVDINMPEVSGIDVVKFIRVEEKSTTPIMVLSGNTDDAVIIEGFELGINDYMKKPLSLNEISARVKRLIDVPKTNNLVENNDNTIIEQRCVGVVIPCYNEEERFLSSEFLDFVDKHSVYVKY